MFLAFVGDVHGCVRHAMTAVLALQHHECRLLDLVIQVGDFGAFPNPDRLGPVDRAYVEANPPQGDVFRLLFPDEDESHALRRVQAALARPILVVSGNHEDHDWLETRHHDSGGDPVVPLDSFGIFEHVADGAVLDLGEVTIGFLGRIDAPGMPYDFDRDALGRMMSVAPGSIDVLVTHDGPFGMSASWNGRVQGSPAITELLERIQPRLHVSGHYHHINGPRSYGETTSFALANLVPAKVKRHHEGPVNPEQRVAPGSIGVIDTEEWVFRYVTDQWLESICGDEVDVDAALDRFGS